jgi:hypothetical protein
MSGRHHLAQLNIARLVAPIDSPQLADFVALLPSINALAEHSPGFVWRVTAEGAPDATSLRPYEPDIAVNLSVWESVEALRDFTYHSAHLDPMRRRREWFAPLGRNHLVLWWVPAGHLPDFAEAQGRLDLLDAIGPSPTAFTLREPYCQPYCQPPPAG